MKKIVLGLYILITILLLLGLVFTFQNRILSESRARQITSQVIEKPELLLSGLQFKPIELKTHKGAILSIHNKDLVGYDALVPENNYEFHLRSGENKKIIFDESGLYTVQLKSFPYVKASIIVE